MKVVSPWNEPKIRSENIWILKKTIFTRHYLQRCMFLYWKKSPNTSLSTVSKTIQVTSLISDSSTLGFGLHQWGDPVTICFSLNQQLFLAFSLDLVQNTKRTSDWCFGYLINIFLINSTPYTEHADTLLYPVVKFAQAHVDKKSLEYTCILKIKCKTQLNLV